mmetsp:Transcript_16294/g.33327  ORF Transcript_16294/g.33327 Transcript_16294/m.33327 type:complete len:250 (+) Transcript_16294:233-982(+)
MPDPVNHETYSSRDTLESSRHDLAAALQPAGPSRPRRGLETARAHRRDLELDGGPHGGELWRVQPGLHRDQRGEPRRAGLDAHRLAGHCAHHHQRPGRVGDRSRERVAGCVLRVGAHHHPVRAARQPGRGHGGHFGARRRSGPVGRPHHRSADETGPGLPRRRAGGAGHGLQPREAAQTRLRAHAEPHPAGDGGWREFCASSRAGGGLLCQTRALQNVAAPLAGGLVLDHAPDRVAREAHPNRAPRHEV